MSRRPNRAIRVLAAVTVLATAALGTGCGSQSRTGRTIDLTVVSFGGAAQDAMVTAWQEPYTARYPGVRFVNTYPPDFGQIQAQVQLGAVTYDLVSTYPWQAGQSCDTVYAKLDVADLDEMDLAPNAHGDCFVAGFRYGLIFSYNAEKWPDPQTAPRTIRDFFDTQAFPGRRGVAASPPDGILEWALIADGVDVLYPLDVDRALARWESIRGETTWAADADALTRLVVEGEVDLQLLVQPRSLAALDAGAPIVPVWDTTLTSMSGLAVPKGSARQDDVERFLTFVLQPEQQARIATLYGVAPVNLEARPALADNARLVDAFGPANSGQTVAVDQAWWTQNGTEVSARFDAWLNPPD